MKNKSDKDAFSVITVSLPDQNLPDSENRKEMPMHHKIVVITGGSQGIGFATAKRVSTLGASLCLIARNEERLKLAAEEISDLQNSRDQFVAYIACDATSMNKLKPRLEAFVEEYGVPDYLINAAGYAYPQYIEKLSIDDFRKNMDVNYSSQLVPILIPLPFFMKSKKGHIVNIASILGFMGMMGYATYTPTKYAIVGLSETLRNELKPHSVNVSVVFPPDTKTEGFKRENQSKPPETGMMSEGAKLMSPDDVAKIIVKGVLKKKFFIFPGESKFIYHINRLFPWFIRYYMDFSLKKARKKKH